MERRLTVIANVAIIIVAVVALAGLIRNNSVAQRAWGPTGQRPNPATLIGRQFPISEPWSSHSKTIVLALQVGCHYCSASASFYRALTDQAVLGRTTIVALLPGPTDESIKYLSELGLDIPLVQQVDFRQISVTGTPTLFLVDNKGFVLRVWQGQLQDQEQLAVLSLLG